MNLYHSRTFAWLVLGLLAACATAPPPRGHVMNDAHGGDGPRRGPLFISPMGEPFRGEGRDASMAMWFNGADVDHDARLSRTEFRRDALRFFKTLDGDGNGELSPDEVRHYETVVAPEISVGGSGGGGPARGGDGGGGGHHGGTGGGRGGMGGGGMGGGGGHHGGGGNAAPATSSGGGGEGLQGAGRFGLLNIPEPVASTDSDFNRTITQSEFLAAADRRFDVLDLDADGFIARTELPRRASAKAAGDRKPA